MILIMEILKYGKRGIVEFLTNPGVKKNAAKRIMAADPVFVKKNGGSDFSRMGTILDQAEKMMEGDDGDVGGIDFNPSGLELKIKRDSQDMPMMLNPVELQNIHIDGLVPIIINISPVTDLPLLLGAADEMEEMKV